MKTCLVLAGSVLVAAVGSVDLEAQARLQPAHATISQVAWIAGAWSGAANSVTFEERWTAPAGGAMLAVSRTIKGDRMVAFEFLRIIERNGGLAYVAQPNGQPPTDFVLTALTAESATFENPAHDFPGLQQNLWVASGSGN